MKLELTLKTKDAVKARDFYSAIGIEWLRGEDEFESFEEYEDGNMGLPDLVGKIDCVEISFYIDKSAGDKNVCSPLMVIHPATLEEFNLIISRLKKSGLYLKISNSKPFYEETLLDPDGHCIAICPINPFAQFENLLK
jgi:predicted lactoylglutathione lyase